jgi:hypothetical protein
MHAEMNRPLGLMEQRELDDNEPLSRRRNRLQGRTPMTARQSALQLGGGVNMGLSGGAGPPSPNLRVPSPDMPEDEEEGETLAARARRLRGEEDAGDNPLPWARPVSTAFSVELLSQLGDAFKDEEKEAAKEKPKVAPTEEEETLGQRRRRLQAEREAREKEMGSGATLEAPRAQMFPKRHSMADVLGVSRRTVLTDPRADAERVKQEEAARYKKDQEQKMAVLRAQMPTTLTIPTHQKTGAYMSGQFNDGNAGGIGRPRLHSSHGASAANGMGQQAPLGMNGGVINGGMMGNVSYGIGAVGGGYGMPNGQFGYGGMPMQTQLQMPMQQPGYQYDRVNQWRQSVIP